MPHAPHHPDTDARTQAHPVAGAPDAGAPDAGAPGGGGWLLGGRYRVAQRIGAGGMAEVFKAHDELLDRDVAVKVFRTMVDDPDATMNGANRRELELQAMARLNHPNLVTLYDGSVAGEGPAYLVLEYVDGPNLASRLMSGPLPEPAVRELGAQIADALAYVHAHGLVHRDVKPANILLGTEDGTGRARLSDFGVVRMIGRAQMTSADLTLGTAYYLAPEQARGSAVGPEADVYALGLLLLECLTGARAFDGPMHEALAARLTTDPAIPAGLPTPWPELLTSMTAREPAQRPDAATVARHLRGFGATGALAAAAGAATGPLIAAGVASGPVTALPASNPAMAAALAAPAVAAAAPEHRRHHWLRPGLLVAALVVAAAVALGMFLMQGKPAAQQPTGTDSTIAPTSAPTTSASHRASASRSANVVNAPATHAPAKKKAKHSTAAHSSARHSAPAAGATVSSSAPAPSTSAVTSAPPSSLPASTPTPQPSDTGAASTSAGAVANAAPTTSPTPGG